MIGMVTIAVSVSLIPVGVNALARAWEFTSY